MDVLGLMARLAVLLVLLLLTALFQVHVQLQGMPQSTRVDNNRETLLLIPIP